MDVAQLLKGTTSMSSIYKLIQKLDSITESTGAEQRGVKQMGAEFNPRSIQALGSKTDPQHPADGYLVGEEKNDKDSPPFDPDKKPMSDKDEYGNVVKHKARHLAHKGMRQAVDVKTGSKKVDEVSNFDESVAIIPPEFPKEWSKEKKKAAWNKWMDAKIKAGSAAQKDVEALAQDLRKRQQEKDRGTNESTGDVRYAIVHKVAKKVLSTHDDMESAKDEWRGLDQDQRSYYKVVKTSKAPADMTLDEYQLSGNAGAVPTDYGVEENKKKGLYYNVNKRKKAGISRDADHSKAPTDQAWKDAAKTAKKEDVAEVSQDPAEINRAAEQIAKILDSSKGTQWGDYTLEQLKQIQQLAKITGRRYSIWQSKKLGREMRVGSIIDLMSEFVRKKQRDSGEMPEFTGRAATAKDMAKQIALQTNGRSEWRHGTTWTDGRTGRRHRDPQDYVAYGSDKAAYDDAWKWIEGKGKKVHYKDNFGDLKTAVQIGNYIIQPSTKTRAAFSDNPTTEYSVSVRSAKAIGQPTRTKQDITDQQAAAIRDIANTRGENAMQMIKALIDVLDGEKDVQRVIDQSKKIDPRDKAKLDQIIAGADNFKEGKTHLSPSGVETNMDPSDDDYEINYGKNGGVAKFRKKQGLDIKTGKKVNEVDMSSPEFQQALARLKKMADQGPLKTVYDPKTKKYRNVPVDQKSEPVKESADHTYEDILSKLKTRLGDYLGDVAQAVKDTDLSDKPTPTSDTVDAVKTVMTDDGHEIRIHGNEDDGFRITIKNKDSKSKFASLKEAEMAAEMYRRRRQRSSRTPRDYESEK
jgi:hypothetical protein